MVQPTSSVSRFMIVGLASDELSLIEMSVLARWTIAPRLLGVPGVANVAVWGNRDRQLQVQVDPTRLEQAGVTLNQIVETTGNALWVSPLSFLKASSPGAGGFIESPAQRLGIWHVLPISTPADLARVPIDGTDLTLGQVTTIVEDHQPLIGDAIVDDRTNLMLVIDKLPGANTLEVTKGVESALGSLSQGLSEIKFDTTLYRPATFLETAISNISRGIRDWGCVVHIGHRFPFLRLANRLDRHHCARFFGDRRHICAFPAGSNIKFNGPSWTNRCPGDHH